MMINLNGDTDSASFFSLSSDIKHAVHGPVIIIDDAFGDEDPRRVDSKIVKIKEDLEREGFMVVTYPELPPSQLDLSSASFVILDWNMKPIPPAASTDLGGLGVTLGSELLQDVRENVLCFVDQLLDKHPVPVFIFTNEPETKVREDIDAFFTESDNVNKDLSLIDVKSKSDMSDSSGSLFNFIDSWFCDNPAAYVMAAWRNSIVSCANDLFRRLYNASPNWPVVIWKSLLEDISDKKNRTPRDKQIAANELGAFLTRVLANTLSDYGISDSRLCKKNIQSESSEVVRNVIEQERYLELVNEESSCRACCCGDLFYIDIDADILNDTKGETCQAPGSMLDLQKDDAPLYLLVISADCDLSRERDPWVAVVAGKEIEVPKNNKVEIMITDDTPQITVHGESRNIMPCVPEDQENELWELNRWINNSLRDDPRVGLGGDLLRRHNETIIPCIAGKKAIAFRHNIRMCRFSDINNYRIGRLLPPYVTKVQQGASNHLVRVGLEPVPRVAFE